MGQCLIICLLKLMLRDLGFNSIWLESTRVCCGTLLQGHCYDLLVSSVWELIGFHFVIKEAAREVFSVCFISSHIRHSIMLPILLACILEDFLSFFTQILINLIVISFFWLQNLVSLSLIVSLNPLNTFILFFLFLSW